MIIQINKTVYQSLSESERCVVDFINQNEARIPLLSITSIADKTFTSPATVTRAIQKCGFQGITELRYKLSVDTKDEQNLRSPYAVNEILDKSFRECTKTIDNLNITSILQAIDYIKNSKRIFIYARGFTALIAEELQMYLQLIGYDAVIVKDVMWMLHTDKIVTADDTVIILSIRNSTKELARSARTAKKIGAKVITCCCKSPTDLEQYSDITLIGHSELIMNAKGQTVYSRIPLMIISRTIIEYLGS